MCVYVCMYVSPPYTLSDALSSTHIVHGCDAYKKRHTE